MTKEKILTDLDRIKSKLQKIEAESKAYLKSYAGDAVELAWEAVCHAIDLVNQSEDMRLMVSKLIPNEGQEGDVSKHEYEVCIPITGVIWVTVEAEDEKAAIQAAFESEDLTLDNVEEWQAHDEICSGNVLHASQNEAYAVKVSE